VDPAIGGFHHGGFHQRRIFDFDFDFDYDCDMQRAGWMDL